VLAIFISACVAAALAIEKTIRPHAPEHLLALGLAGAIGFLGNEVAALVRLRAGRRLNRPALVADGCHARTDGFSSLGVMLSAALVALGLPIADPIIAIVITGVILRITDESWRKVRATTTRKPPSQRPRQPRVHRHPRVRPRCLRRRSPGTHHPSVAPRADSFLIDP
jgi:divalent metal cation (Fe/Co/Zn/Cd) transporter